MGNQVATYMRRAYERNILIPAINASYPEMVEPICRTLRGRQVFGLVQVALPDITKMGAVSFRAIFEEYARCADPEYVGLHQDHVPAVDESGNHGAFRIHLREAMELGFDSVMIDGSMLSLADNIAVTREIVAEAHRRDIAVEGELGMVVGHGDKPMPPYDRLFETKEGFTKAEDAKRFVAETNVDWLSVAIGNIHGAIVGAAKDEKKIEAKLDIGRLTEIKRATEVPIVLHGGSGIKSDYIREAVKNGVAKLNIGTSIRHVYERVMRETDDDFQKAQFAVSEAIENMVVDYYGIAGSYLRIRD